MTNPNDILASDHPKGAATDSFARETALRENLQVISASRADEMPVFKAILESAARVCNVPIAGLQLVNQTRTHFKIARQWGVNRDSFKDGEEMALDGPTLHAEAMREARAIQIEDMADTALYKSGHPRRVRLVDGEGLRTVLVVPLIGDGVAVGRISLSRLEVKPFTDDEITLVETFAEQAVIAIENVRQFQELQTRLEWERATSDILEVISKSRDDEKPVFDLILKNATELCNADAAALALGKKGDAFQTMPASYGIAENTLEIYATGQVSMDPALSVGAEAILSEKVVHVRDMSETENYRSGVSIFKSVVEDTGIRTNLLVPLLTPSGGIGVLILFRKVVKPYTADEIALVETFAAQAVIAIENVRQFNALEQLNAELGDRVSEQVDELERMGRLKRFLSPQVADAVVSSGDDNLLGSHRAMIAILFCDIRGFTAFCESAEPEETIEVLQVFHETLGKLIHAAGAGFDHRAGDGIMVVFNDPVPCDDPAEAALRVAVQMRECMVEICTKWRKLGHRMGFGVGISLGYATVGMVGFEGRYDYTASGTAVNLAARLCDQAADQEILLGQRAATAPEAIAEIESAGELTLKGFHAPVDVFRLNEMKETQ